MGRHPNDEREAPAGTGGADPPAFDFGESPAQRLFREVRDRLGLGKTLKPCGCCRKLTVPYAVGALRRPCGCAIRICTEDHGEVGDDGQPKACFKCVAHCPHKEGALPKFDSPEQVIAALKGKRR